MRWPLITRVALAAYLAVLLFVLFNPSSHWGSAAVVKIWNSFSVLGLEPTYQTAVRIEFVLNVLILIPATFLAALVWRKVRWERWTAYAFVFSFSVEMTQALLPGRSATHSDVVANTLGGFLGAALAGLLFHVLVRRTLTEPGNTPPADGAPPRR